MSVHGDHEGGAAKRRRDRRLRMHWRHEQLTVQMALAAAFHHSRDVGPVTYNALRSQTTSVAGDTEFFSLCEEELGGTRPDRLYEVRLQERVQRRTVEQIVDNTLFLPTLDVSVPQLDNQLVEVCRLLDVLIPEQAIEVPKISSSSRRSCRRRVRSAQQIAEQLVEVPTIVSYSSLHGLVEQNVDIPVPSGRGGRVGVRGLQGSPGQNPTAFGEAEHFPVGTAEQLFDIPVPRGGRVLHPASSSSGLSGTANQGVFRPFHLGKKCDVGSALGVGTAPRVELIHASGSAGGFLHGRSWCVDAVSRWLVETSGLGPRSLAAWVKAGTEPSSCISLRLLLEEIRRDFLSFVLAQFALGIWYIISFVFASGSYCSGRLGIAEEYGNLDFSGDAYFRWCNALYNSGYMFFGCFGRIYTFSTWRRTRFLKRCFSIRFEWRSVPSRCFGCSLALRGSHLETLDFLLRVSRVELHDDGWVFRHAVRHFSASSSELRPCQFVPVVC